MASRLKLSPGALTMVSRLPKVVEACTAKAQPVADRASQLTPKESGAAADDIKVVPATDIPTPEGIRGGAYVVQFSKLGHLIEFGTGMRETREGANRGEMPAFAPMRRAAESTGAFRPRTTHA